MGNIMMMNPLAILLNGRIFVELTMPDPPPEGIAREQVRMSLVGLTPSQLSVVSARVQDLRNLLTLITEELETVCPPGSICDGGRPK